MIPSLRLTTSRRLTPLFEHSRPLYLSSLRPQPPSQPPSQLQPQPHSRLFSSSPVSPADFTHAVIGGGAVGLAIARELSSQPGTSTLLIERHGVIGSETSSRNSEVIHAGLYYGPDTLKTNLCIEGRRMMYDLCSRRGIPHRNTKKWILAQDEQQMHELEKLHAFTRDVLDHDRVPTRFLPLDEVQRREPDVRADAGVLESETTGIVDSHAYMACLEGDFLDNGGEEALHTVVTRIEKSPSSSGYTIYSRGVPSSSSSSSSSPPHTGTNTGTSTDGEDAISVETLINSAGLGAMAIQNLLLPPSLHRTPYYAKGSYYSYSASHPRPSVLLYPAPVPGHGGLGTHLTLDMAGRIRFGPDVEWVSDPTDLAPNPDPVRFRTALDVIRSYLPAVDAAAVDLDYCGIRPKLADQASGTAGAKTFQDFYIRDEKDHGFPGFVNLLAIESPGLTASLAIGKYVREMLYGSSGGN